MPFGQAIIWKVGTILYSVQLVLGITSYSGPLLGWQEDFPDKGVAMVRSVISF